MRLQCLRFFGCISFLLSHYAFISQSRVTRPKKCQPTLENATPFQDQSHNNGSLTVCSSEPTTLQASTERRITKVRSALSKRAHYGIWITERAYLWGRKGKTRTYLEDASFISFWNGEEQHFPSGTWLSSDIRDTEIHNELISPRPVEEIMQEGKYQRAALDSPAEPNWKDESITPTNPETDYRLWASEPVYQYGPELSTIWDKFGKTPLEHDRTLFVLRNFGPIPYYEKPTENIFSGSYSQNDGVLILNEVDRAADRQFGFGDEVTRPLERLLYIVADDFKITNERPETIQRIFLPDVQDLETLAVLELIVEERQRMMIRQRKLAPGNKLFRMTVKRSGKSDSEWDAFNMILGSRGVSFIEEMLWNQQTSFRRRRILKFRFYRKPAGYAYTYHLLCYLGNEREVLTPDEIEEVY